VTVEQAQAYADYQTSDLCQKQKQKWEATISRMWELREALGWLYDKWENGTPCFEGGPDDESCPLGNAFRLSCEEEERILKLLARSAPDSEKTKYQNVTSLEDKQ
jgi:hypothetical protein